MSEAELSALAWIILLVVQVLVGLGVIAFLFWIAQEIRRWHSLVRAYLEQRAHKQLVTDDHPNGEPVSSLHLPPDLQAILEEQEEREGLR